MKISTPLPKLNVLSLTLSEPERWALTKAALIGIASQAATFGPEDLDGELFDFSQAEFAALQSAFRKLNPEND